MWPAISCPADLQGATAATGFARNLDEKGVPFVTAGAIKKNGGLSNFLLQQ
jgi:hypothetical protein